MEKNKALDAAISQIKEKQLLNEEEKTNKEKFTYKLDKPLSNTEEFELAGRVLKEQKKKGGLSTDWYYLGEKPTAAWASKFGRNGQYLENMPDRLQKWFRKFMKGQFFDEDDVDVLAQQNKQQKEESSSDLGASLKRLKKMYNDGNLSKAEFEKAKNKLLK